MAHNYNTPFGPDTVPVGAVMAFPMSVDPPGWLLCYGQAVSRTGPTARLFAAVGTTYGTGDGSTTFNVPDCRGRVIAGRDNMGGTSADRLTTPINGDVLGVAGGAQQQSLNSTTRSDLTGGGTEAAVQTIDAVAVSIQPTIIFNYYIKL